VFGVPHQRPPEGERRDRQPAAGCPGSDCGRRG
jgi:hypothetical protein